MSLIIDINPVPWEILDRVKARLLKNRANRQKRQPEKGKELRRVMRVDNGILAKQRWEEPSFIAGDNRVFAIGLRPHNSAREYIVQFPVSFTVSVNGQTLGNVNFPLILNRTQSYYFIWSQDENEKTEILNNLFGNFVYFSDIVTVAVETQQPDPDTPIVIEFSNIYGPPNSYGRNYGISFLAGFSFDEEFPGKRGESNVFSWGINDPGKLTFEYNDWK